MATVQDVLNLTKKGGKKKGKKGRKIGRSNRHPAAKRYKEERRWEKNKVRRMKRHIKLHPNDAQAERLLKAA